MLDTRGPERNAPVRVRFFPDRSGKNWQKISRENLKKQSSHHKFILANLTD